MKNFTTKGISDKWKAKGSLYRDLSGRMSQQVLNFDSNNVQEVIKYAANFTDGHCIYCGKKLYTVNNDVCKFTNETSLEHLIPVSNWGLFAKGNIALACKECNSSRSTLPFNKFFNMMHSKNKPTLYDTEDEFLLKINEFQIPYQKAFPQLYDMGYRLMMGDIKESEVNITVSFNDNGIQKDVIMPISVGGGSSTTATINDEDKDELNKLILHVKKMTSATNPIKRQAFEHAVDKVFITLQNQNFNTVKSIRKMKKNAVNNLVNKIKKNNNVSTDRAKLAISFIGIALDNANLTINDGLMPGLIERMGYKFIFNGK